MIPMRSDNCSKTSKWIASVSAPIVFVAIALSMSLLSQAPAQAQRTQAPQERSVTRTFELRYDTSRLQLHEKFLGSIADSLHKEVKARVKDDVPYRVAVYSLENAAKPKNLFGLSVIGSDTEEQLQKVSDAVLAELRNYLRDHLVSSPMKRVDDRAARIEADLEHAERRIRDLRLDQLRIQQPEVAQNEWESRRTQLMIEASIHETKVRLLERRLEEILVEREKMNSRREEIQNLQAAILDQMKASATAESQDTRSRLKQEFERVQLTLLELEKEGEFQAGSVQDIKTAIADSSIDMAVQSEENKAIRAILEKEAAKRVGQESIRFDIDMQLGRIERERDELLEALQEIRRERRALDQFDFRIWK